MAQYVLAGTPAIAWQAVGDTTAPNQVLAEIITPLTERISITEIAISGPTPGGPTADIGIGRSSTVGTPRQIAATPVPYFSGSPASNVTLVTNWITGPVFPTKWFRRQMFPTSNLDGYLFVFRFPNGLIVPPSSSLIVVIVGSNGNFTFPTSLFGGITVEFDA